MSQTLGTHTSWADEKKVKWWRWMLIGDLSDPSLSDELKAKVRREFQSLVILGIILATLVALALFRRSLGI
jgi:hypothetical protein